MNKVTYQEPELSVLVLDFAKPDETYICLRSVRERIKFPHKVIYLHNGPAEYAYEFYKLGLVDHFIQSRSNNGLGVGTRDLVAACFSPYFLMLQNDQVIGREFEEGEFRQIVKTLKGPEFGDERDIDNDIVISVSVAGSPCGKGVYSERAHIMETSVYKHWEENNMLGYHGAGRYHNGEWREAQIQRIYREKGYTHYEWPTPLVIDNGRTAMRQNPDESIWMHFPDTKALFLVRGPVKERHVYPKLTDEEWESVLTTQSWPAGKIPENEVKDSFHVWN